MEPGMSSLGVEHPAARAALSAPSLDIAEFVAVSSCVVLELFFRELLEALHAQSRVVHKSGKGWFRYHSIVLLAESNGVLAPIEEYRKQRRMQWNVTEAAFECEVPESQ